MKKVTLPFFSVLREMMPLRWLALSLLTLSTLLATQQAQAVPSFARQTGMDCFVCHTNYPELTPFGRQFKLLGYTLTRGPNKDSKNHLAAMIEAAMTHTANTANQDPSNFPHNNQLFFPQASLFYAGNLTEHSGAFVQFTYDSSDTHKWGADNTDIRYARLTSVSGKTLIYGITLNNTPTVSDIYNSTPVWGYPYLADPDEAGPGAATVVDGGLGAGTVGGFGAYAFFNHTLYGEVALYRPSTGVMKPLGINQDAAALDGTAPYWRLAAEHQFGNHDVMIGTYGLIANIYPDPTNPTAPSDRFRDLAVDAQYQYLGDKHVFSATGTIINEKQTLNAMFASGSSANPTNTLRTARVRGSYLYNHKYGATLSLFDTSGSADSILYAPGAFSGFANNVPDTRGYVVELDYFPVHKVKLALQYTGYTKFNGAQNNYDSAGRNAKDNNTTFLVGQFMF